MPPKRSYPGVSASKAQKRSRGNGTSLLRGRREPPASSPNPGARHCYPEADASTPSSETAETAPISLSTDEEPQLMSLNISDDSVPYLSSSGEDDMETVRCSTPFEGNSSVEATAGSVNSDSPPQVLSLSSDEDGIETVRCSTPFYGSSTVSATAGSLMSDSPPSVSVAPHYGSPGYGPLNSTMVEGGVPINMMSSPSTSVTPVPLVPPPRDLTNEPCTSARASPLSAPGQSEDEPSSTMTRAIPPCPLGLHRQAQLRQMRRYNVHFSGFLPRHKQ
ncbi:mucin-1-like [Dermacentor silvarum]|uniref:mucin-1-like n=1 Tax=Dermacentor silvarum TaxID=543639 RepID=UPI00189B67BD|nr:mucin-1-like [Dermacentor silvarum]